MIRRSIAPLAVAVVTAVCLLPTLSGSFLNWDDDVNFLGNQDYRGLGAKQLHWAFTSVLFGHYMPLTRLTFSLNYVLGGMDPWGYHLLNLLLHVVNAALLYVVARRLLGAAAGDDRQETRPGWDTTLGAAVAALMFSVHPLRVESVAWITGRADELCGTFVLLAVWAYLRAVDGPDRARRSLMIVCAVAFAAAIGSKAVAVPLPAALLIVDVYPLRRLSRLGWWPLVKEKTPLFVLSLVGTVATLYAARGVVLTATADFGIAARIAVTVYGFVVSALRFVWPAALSPIYEMPAHVDPLGSRFGVALIAGLLVTAVLVILRRRWPGGLAAWTFSCLMLLPTSGAVRRTTDLAPDRYTYLAGLGFAVLAGGAALGFIRLARRGAIAPSIVVAGALGGVAAFAGLGVTSWTLSQMWRDSETLWRWAVDVDPSCAVCHGKLGESIYLTGPSRMAEAETEFRRAIALRPDQRHPHFNLGNVLVVQGRYAEAEGPLRRYMELEPEAPVGPERLGRLYLLQKRYAQAVPLLRAAVTRKSNTPGLRGDLSEALRARASELQAGGHDDEAAALLGEARALDEAHSPRSPQSPRPSATGGS